MKKIHCNLQLRRSSGESCPPWRRLLLQAGLRGKNLALPRWECNNLRQYQAGSVFCAGWCRVGSRTSVFKSPQAASNFTSSFALRSEEVSRGFNAVI